MLACIACTQAEVWTDLVQTVYKLLVPGGIVSNQTDDTVDELGYNTYTVFPHFAVLDWTDAITVDLII